MRRMLLKTTLLPLALLAAGCEEQTATKVDVVPAVSAALVESVMPLAVGPPAISYLGPGPALPVPRCFSSGGRVEVPNGKAGWFLNRDSGCFPCDLGHSYFAPGAAPPVPR